MYSALAAMTGFAAISARYLSNLRFSYLHFGVKLKIRGEDLTCKRSEKKIA